MPIYGGMFARMMALKAGRSWRPACQVEADLFATAMCARCAANADLDYPGCAISAAAYYTDIVDPGYPPEWVIGPDGQPTCTAFQATEDRATQCG